MMGVEAAEKEGRYSSISIVPARSMPILISKKTCGFGMLAAVPPAETSSSESGATFASASLPGHLGASLLGHPGGPIALPCFERMGGTERPTVKMDQLERSLLHLEEEYRSTVEAGMVRLYISEEAGGVSEGEDDFGEFQGGYAPLGEGDGTSESDEDGRAEKSEETGGGEGWWDEEEEAAAAQRAANGAGGGAGSVGKALSAADVKTIKDVMGRCAPLISAPLRIEMAFAASRLPHSTLAGGNPGANVWFL